MKPKLLPEKEGQPLSLLLKDEEEFYNYFIYDIFEEFKNIYGENIEPDLSTQKGQNQLGCRISGAFVEDIITDSFLMSQVIYKKIEGPITMIIKWEDSDELNQDEVARLICKTNANFDIRWDRHRELNGPVDLTVIYSLWRKKDGSLITNTYAYCEDAKKTKMSERIKKEGGKHRRRRPRQVPGNPGTKR